MAVSVRPVAAVSLYDRTTRLKAPVLDPVLSRPAPYPPVIRHLQYPTYGGNQLKGRRYLLTAPAWVMGYPAVHLIGVDVELNRTLQELASLP